ncbi:MAG: DUF1697 domain-containing protein [Bacteroidetes bacterium]|nr:DUF1697 domain-containing protein [Bacteroidota bacterium]
METYIALLRGINVSGKNLIKMTDLSIVFTSIGISKIKTYKQSGNILFEHSSLDTDLLQKEIELSIKYQFQLNVPTLIRSKTEWTKIIEKNPFNDPLKYDENSLHLTFLNQIPSVDQIEKLMVKNVGTDEFKILEREIYIHCPNGYGKTKFTNTFFEQQLKMNCTTRNWKTLQALEEMDF